MYTNPCIITGCHSCQISLIGAPLAGVLTSLSDARWQAAACALLGTPVGGLALMQPACQISPKLRFCHPRKHPDEENAAILILSPQKAIHEPPDAGSAAVYT